MDVLTLLSDYWMFLNGHIFRFQDRQSDLSFDPQLCPPMSVVAIKLMDGRATRGTGTLNHCISPIINDMYGCTDSFTFTNCDTSFGPVQPMNAR